MCLNTIGESIRGKQVIWYTGSKNVCRILEVGSRKSYLHEIAVTIFEKLQNLQIILIFSGYQGQKTFKQIYLAGVLTVTTGE